MKTARSLRLIIRFMVAGVPVMGAPFLPLTPAAAADGDLYEYKCTYRVGDSTDRYYITLNATDSLDAIKQIKDAHPGAIAIECAKGKKIQ